MESYEIYNLVIPELVTASFSVDWSEDNQISVITSRGVHVLELQPNILCSTSTAKFKRSFIYPSSYLPSEPFIPTTSSLINNFERQDLYLAILEEIMAPKLPDKNDITPKIVAIAWSPVKLVQPSRCLLAIVTSAGAIDLVLKLGKDWYSVCNLSKIWWEIVKDELTFNPENIDYNVVDAEIFRNNLRRLQCTAITWSELYEDSCSTHFSFFTVAFRSCDVIVWKIMEIQEMFTEIKPILTYRIKFDIDVKIRNLLWISLSKGKYFILIGFSDGRIYRSNLGASKEYVVQNADGIPVTCMKELSRTNDEIYIAVVKNFFIIIMIYNLDGELLKQMHVQLAVFPITGLLVIEDNAAIITTQDAKMYWFKFDKKSKLTYEPITSDSKTSKVQFLGLAKSPSGVIFINITVPDGLYDHLITRDPTTVQLFSFKGEKWDPWIILNKNDNNVSNTRWDCLEVIRIRASKEIDPENFLPRIPEILDSMPIDKLRNMMWITLITEILKKKKFIIRIDNLVGEISEAQPLILVHSVSSHMIRLAKKNILTDDMRLSIHFLRLYLEVFLAGEDDSSSSNDNNCAINCAKNALKATENLDLIEVETCKLCNKVVTELPWNNAQCPDGHCLPRCALTLLQITCLNHRACPICGRIFHPSLDEEYQNVKCLYCDVSAVYDNRIIGINDDLERNCQNLSLQPLWETQKNRSQESETSAVNEKRSKKRRITPDDTFTFILNKDDEIIKETWQEL